LQTAGAGALRFVDTADAVTGPKKKKKFDWVYVEETPVAYKTQFLDGHTYICDNFTRGEFNRLIHPQIEKLMSKRAGEGGKVRVADLGSCFGNTTLAVVNGMTTDQIKDNWADMSACETINFPRRFPAHVTSIDMSGSALAYGKRSGIADETITANLNSEEGLQSVREAMRASDVLISTGALVYLNVESVDFLIGQFAAGEGEAYAIVNFLHPFDTEKTDQMKRILLKHLDFVGSTAARFRTLGETERESYPEFGDWVLMEIWTLKRRSMAA